MIAGNLIKTWEDLKAKGFDVLVFVPSIDEEHGLVTCGNAILGEQFKIQWRFNKNRRIKCSLYYLVNY